MTAPSIDQAAYERILTAIADLRAADGAPMRIIVNVPLIGKDSIARVESNRTWIVGADAWKEMLARCIPRAVEVKYPSTVYGTPVEEFDIRRDDHRSIIRSLLQAMAGQ